MIAQGTTTMVHGGLRLPWTTLILSAVMVGAHLLFGPASALWVFDRGAILEGELWRLLSGHLVHTDTEHLTLNLVAFLVLGGSLESLLGWPWWKHLGVLLVGSVAIDLAIFLFLPGLDLYCGLSGTLNALLTVLLVKGWSLTESPLYPLIGVGAVAKIIVEALLGTALFSSTAWPPLPLAHAAGFAAGLVFAGCIASTLREGDEGLPSQSNRGARG